MNQTIFTGLIALALGIGIGWVLKPDPAPFQVTSEAAAAAPGTGERSAPLPDNSATTAALSTKSDRSPTGPASPEDAMPWNSPQPGEGAGVFSGVFAPPNPEELAEARRRLSDDIDDGHDDQIALLAHELTLTSEQQAQLRAQHFHPLRDATLAFRFDDDEADPAPPPPDLATVLARVLSDEQAAVYEELRTRHRRQFIESETLSELADYTHLGLSREQQDAFYDVLYREIDSEMEEDDNPDTVIGAAGGAIIGAIIGNNVNNPHATRGALIGAALTPPLDEEASAQAQQENIDREIARFREVLTPAQIERFRADLERQHRGTVYTPLDPHLPPLPE